MPAPCPPSDFSRRAFGRALARWMLALLFAALGCLPAGAALPITLLLSEAGGIYQEAAQALARELDQDAGKWSVRMRGVDAAAPVGDGEDGVTVAFGVRALQHALSAPGDGPLFVLLVPGLTFEKLVAERPQNLRRRALFPLYLDQPFTRQLRLIRLALPEVRRVGVVLGPSTEGQADDLRKAGREVGLDVELRPIRTQEQLFSGLNALARETDALLLLPDPLVVRRETLQVLFLQTYRQRLPVVAYSTGLVQAGALFGLYTTPAQLGIEGGKWVREMPWDRGGRLAAPRYPRYFAVDVNQNVARSLELVVASGERLATRLDAEGGR